MSSYEITTLTLIPSSAISFPQLFFFVRFSSFLLLFLFFPLFFHSQQDVIFQMQSSQKNFTLQNINEKYYKWYYSYKCMDTS